MRDEDGKTPLDKARERGDEGHREVIQILQAPGNSNVYSVTIILSLNFEVIFQ